MLAEKQAEALSLSLATAFTAPQPDIQNRKHSCWQHWPEGQARPVFAQFTQTPLSAANRLVVSEDPKFSILLTGSFEKIIYQNKPTTYIQHKDHRANPPFKVLKETFKATW